MFDRLATGLPVTGGQPPVALVRERSVANLVEGWSKFVLGDAKRFVVQVEPLEEGATQLASDLVGRAGVEPNRISNEIEAPP